MANGEPKVHPKTRGRRVRHHIKQETGPNSEVHPVFGHATTMTMTRAGVTRKSQPRPSEMKPHPLDVRKLPERWSNTTLGLPVSPEHCSSHATHNPTEDAGGGGPVRHPRMPP